MISITAVVTTIVENRIFMIWCRPTFLCYSAIVHALLSRAYMRQLFLVPFVLCNTVEQERYVVEAFKANPSSSRSLGGDSPNHNQTV